MPGHTGNFPGHTRLAAATPDRRRSPTFSVTGRVNEARAPAVAARTRALREDFVCALPRGRH
ncbi:hypothetical protein ACIBVL_07515 [Streptomyces sp. NPDC049687]|uniref:hypothetical protein n=1 Tax=Streptomyces sp. NPDC049687 TaxID=3365596 RepID=UPI0037BBCA43